jgi:putative oxygen-independent coproporphyrinogen III oxidase
MNLPPLALYVHIPWCLKKCPYCDFNSHAFEGELPQRQYVQRLLTDLDADHGYVQGRQLEAIFIGGGTPSLFSPDSIGTLLEGIGARIPFAEGIEITLEANPGTFEVEKFRGFRQAGINRLSIGIQSFDPAFLLSLGRVHDDNEARQAAGQARDAGFDNFNLDLMFGLPGQDTGQALADLETALSFKPPHLSWYQLTIEPNTVFYSRPPALPEDDLLAQMQEEGIALLAGNGLERYEVSAYAARGRQSRHNLNYWQFGDYLGIGAGAHGKVTQPGAGGVIRKRKVRQPAAYLDAGKPLTAESVAVPPAELPLEFMMNALRLKAGVDAALFESRTGLSRDVLEPVLAKLRARRLVQQDRLSTTGPGFSFLNDVLAEFMPEPDQPHGDIPVHFQP